MNLKKKGGLAGIDMIIAIVAVTIFSTLIISLMYSNVMENVKLKKETMAMIYLTEILENVGIEDYNNEVYNGLGKDYVKITESNILVPEEVLENYTVEMAVITDFEEKEEILKKIQVKLTYSVGNKNFTCSMERMKIKE